MKFPSCEKMMTTIDICGRNLYYFDSLYKNGRGNLTKAVEVKKKLEVLMPEPKMILEEKDIQKSRLLFRWLNAQKQGLESNFERALKANEIALPTIGEYMSARRAGCSDLLIVPKMDFEVLYSSIVAACKGENMYRGIDPNSAMEFLFDFAEASLRRIQSSFYTILVRPGIPAEVSPEFTGKTPQEMRSQLEQISRDSQGTIFKGLSASELILYYAKLFLEKRLPNDQKMGLTFMTDDYMQIGNEDIFLSMYFSLKDRKMFFSPMRQNEKGGSLRLGLVPKDAYRKAGK